VNALVSDIDVTIAIITLIALLAFMLRSVVGGEMHLIHKMYMGIGACCAIWMLGLIGIRFTAPDNTTFLYIWDALTNIGCAYMPVFSLCFSIAFVTGGEHLPQYAKLFFIVPTITVVLVWTNPLHHFFYRVFSVVRSEAVFGPWLYAAGIYNYLCMMAAVILFLAFAIRNHNRLYTYQALLFSLSNLIPLVVSAGVTLGFLNLSIAATPLSFIATVLFSGIAIYQFHMLDIKPIAMQHVLDWISDCYLVLSDKDLVISFNRPFRDVFGTRYNIAENRYLRDCVAEEDVAAKTPIYNLLTSVESCRRSLAAVSFEQAIGIQRTDSYAKNYYIVDVTPLIVGDKFSGSIVIFKDITQVKKSMQQLQDSQTRMMEQERLAFLGQMVGGLAHNLKTPIMSISGCAAAVEGLVGEVENSLGDSEVTVDDYHEICGEMRDWCGRTREACAYMSDIITAIKGQAANASTTKENAFSLMDLIKRSTLLMHHEMLGANCHLVTKNDVPEQVIFHGDINNLVQVLTNLLSNALYAQKQAGGGTITLAAELDETHLRIYVKDTGPGVDPRVRSRLFREMTTSKGTQGTGLGLYISNAVVRGKFGGSMYLEDNPEGGAIFGISIPTENLEIRHTPYAMGGEEETHEEK